MNKNVKLLLCILLLSLPFWWLTNIFSQKWGEIFYAREITKKPPLIAQLSLDPGRQTPKRIRQSPYLEIAAQAAMSVLIDENGKEFPLFRKNAEEKLAIASISKLITGLTALDIYDSSFKVVVSKEAVWQPEATGNLKVGETLQVKDLVKILLVESSNDAAFALAQLIGEENFIDLMNLEAESLGLKNSHFVNPSGLDPEDLAESEEPLPDPHNYSSAEDLVRLTKYLIFEKPGVLNLLGVKEEPLYLENGIFHHVLKNTNELLGKIPNVIGGKTGYTERAGECLIVILQGPWQGSYFVNVVLNTQNKFQTMQQLIDWVETSYQF